jgi:hypothetical protein
LDKLEEEEEEEEEEDDDEIRVSVLHRWIQHV